MRYCIIVRHGSTEGNERSIFQGQRIDPPLTEKGFRELVTTTGQLETLWRELKFCIHRVYCSPLRRANESLWFIQHSSPELFALFSDTAIVHTDALKEIDQGDWEGCGFHEIQERFPEIFDNWMRDTAAFTFPNGETVAMAETRAQSFAESLVKTTPPDHDVLVMTHAGIAMLLIKYFCRTNYFSVSLANGGMALVRFPDEHPHFMMQEARLVKLFAPPVIKNNP